MIKSETLAYYIGRIYLFVVNSGVKEEKIRFRQHMSNEMAHYANECWDLECETSHVSLNVFDYFDMHHFLLVCFTKGWIECAGIADRCDFDLKQHSAQSGHSFEVLRATNNKSLKIEDEYEKFLPHVIEPSLGIGRIMFAILEHSFQTRENDEKRIVSDFSCC